MSVYKSAMDTLLRGDSLPETDAEAVMNEIMEGTWEPTHIAAFLSVVQARSVQAPMLAAFARAIRGHMVPVRTNNTVLDTCGTGGSGLPTPNTSTMSAFVVAAGGVAVAKHGNRSSSGKCGSADLLEALGIPFGGGSEVAEKLLEETGLAFLFAPAHHPAFRHVGPVRKSLGFRTVFNVLGPLCNPAGATLQLLGVSDPQAAPIMAGALAALGSERVLVLHGDDGLDEASLSAPTRTWLVENGTVHESTITPEEMGLQTVPFEHVSGGDVAENVALFHHILGGKGGAHSQLVALNAGLALFVGGKAQTMKEGVALAQEILASGAAYALFEDYKAKAEAAHG